MHWMCQSGEWGNFGAWGIGHMSLFDLFPILVWALLWKGWALWLAARRGETLWFIALLVVNTFGLLEIFYIFVIAKQQDTKHEKVSLAEPEVKQNTVDS